ncbi:MAG: hypothetical protein H0T72_08750 [Chloroflexia bacterium]|nr:hypothetical protein [Chloroflexia bacterium]
MSGFEWFLLVVVVIAVPLVVAVVVTLWTLEQARQRNRKNRDVDNDAGAGPVKRQASRSNESPVGTAPGADPPVVESVDRLGG